MANIGFIRQEVIDITPEWAIITDTRKGERTVKSRGTTYLPSPQAVGDPEILAARYAAYLLRAVFYNVTKRTIDGLTGQVFSKPPTVELPTELQFLIEDIDGAGTSAAQQAKRTLDDVLPLGRAGLLSDFPALGEGAVITLADVQAGRIRPRILHYSPDRIINWREEGSGGETYLVLVVLTENEIISDDGFEIEYEQRWRVLELVGGTAATDDAPATATRVEVTVWAEAAESTSPSQDQNQYVVVEGPFIMRDYNQQPLTRIPFHFIGAVNNDSEVDEPPMYDISTLNIAHFRVSADLFELAFICGQPTPVISGLEGDWAREFLKDGVNLGSRAAVLLNAGADMKLLQAEPHNMNKELMLMLEDQMSALGAKLIEEKKVAETATGAAIDATAEASVLSSSAQNVSAAYKDAIISAAQFIGEVNADDIKIELNMDFNISTMSAQERAQTIAEWQAGAISWSEVRATLTKQQIATLSEEDARTAIDAEDPDLGLEDA